MDGDEVPSGGGAWFSVRCVFRDEGIGAYEERITLWRAKDAAEAIRLAEAEAIEYAGMLDEFSYAGLAQSYELADPVGHGAEVFSLFRESDLEPEAYLDTFFDTGNECQGEL